MPGWLLGKQPHRQRRGGRGGRGAVLVRAEEGQGVCGQGLFLVSAGDGRVTRGGMCQRFGEARVAAAASLSSRNAFCCHFEETAPALLGRARAPEYCFSFFPDFTFSGCRRLGGFLLLSSAHPCCGSAEGSRLRGVGTQRLPLLRAWSSFLFPSHLLLYLPWGVVGGTRPKDGPGERLHRAVSSGVAAFIQRS